MKSTEKAVIAYVILSIVALQITFTCLYNNTADKIYYITLGLLSGVFVVSLVLMNSKIHIALILKTLYEIGYDLCLSLMSTGRIELKPNVLLIVSFVALVSTMIMAIRKLKEKGDRVNLVNIIKFRLEPKKIGIIATMFIVLSSVSFIFAMTNIYKFTNQDITATAISLAFLPILAMTVSIYPIKTMNLAWITYFILAITVVEKSHQLMGTPYTPIIEPTVYLVSLLVGIVYSRKSRERNTKESIEKEGRAE